MRLPNPLNYFDNPLIEKRGKRVLVGEVPARDVTYEAVDPNMVAIAFGKENISQFFGYHPTATIVYLFASEADKDEFIAAVQSGTFAPPLFPLRRAIGGPGTLDMFLKNKGAKKVIAAVQYYVHENDLVVTHMVVRPKWRRHHLNKLIVDMIIADVRPSNIWWDEPTDMGLKFMKGYGKGADITERPRQPVPEPLVPTLRKL